jgi:hypothetical protein
MSPSLSTGPRTIAGKLTSSQNAITHGLTAKSPVLPNEDPLAYQAHNAAYLKRYSPTSDDAMDVTWIDSINELSDIRWRLARVPSVEANLIALEVRELTTNPAHAETVAGLELPHIETIAFKRLIESRVLTNLYNQEARLSRRAAKIQQRLEEARDASTRPAAAAPPPPPSPQKSQPERKNEPTQQPIRVIKTGRNEPCPCGSGLKYKRCCLIHPAATLTAAA